MNYHIHQFCNGKFMQTFYDRQNYSNDFVKVTFIHRVNPQLLNRNIQVAVIRTKIICFYLQFSS